MIPKGENLEIQPQPPWKYEKFRIIEVKSMILLTPSPLLKKIKFFDIFKVQHLKKYEKLKII